MQYIDRMKIWDETQNISYDKYSNCPESIKYSEKLNLDISNKYGETKIRVIDDDTINIALKLKEFGYNPLLLNMSDDRQSGGFVERGSGAQEENLFRRSNYFLTLKQDFYPLKDVDCVYSPEITVFRKDEKNFYNLMEESKTISMIAMPAINMPALNNKLEFRYEKDYNLIKEKARQIFQVGLKHNHDALVLSAHGCGAWGCPPKQVAEIYSDVIKEFNGSYKAVVFAIIRNLDLAGNNFDIFYNTLRK
jgi:uncharacterized protein (TIGR02452 family)